MVLIRPNSDTKSLFLQNTYSIQLSQTTNIPSGLGKWLFSVVNPLKAQQLSHRVTVNIYWRQEFVTQHNYNTEHKFCVVRGVQYTIEQKHAIDDFLYSTRVQSNLGLTRFLCGYTYPWCRCLSFYFFAIYINLHPPYSCLKASYISIVYFMSCNITRTTSLNLQSLLI